MLHGLYSCFLSTEKPVIVDFSLDISFRLRSLPLSYLFFHQGEIRSNCFTEIMFTVFTKQTSVFFEDVPNKFHKKSLLCCPCGNEISKFSIISDCFLMALFFQTSIFTPLWNNNQLSVHGNWNTAYLCWLIHKLPATYKTGLHFIQDCFQFLEMPSTQDYMGIFTFWHRRRFPSVYFKVDNVSSLLGMR